MRAVADLARRGRQQRRDDREQRGLAGAVRADERDDLAGSDRSASRRAARGGGRSDVRLPTRSTRSKSIVTRRARDRRQGDRPSRRARDRRARAREEGRHACRVCCLHVDRAGALPARRARRAPTGPRCRRDLELPTPCRPLQGAAPFSPAHTPQTIEADGDRQRQRRAAIGRPMRQAAQRHRQRRPRRDAVPDRDEIRQPLKRRLAHGRRLRALERHAAQLLRSDGDVLERQREALVERPIGRPALDRETRSGTCVTPGANGPAIDTREPAMPAIAATRPASATRPTAVRRQLDDDRRRRRDRRPPIDSRSRAGRTPSADRPGTRSQIACLRPEPAPFPLRPAPARERDGGGAGRRATAGASQRRRQPRAAFARRPTRAPRTRSTRAARRPRPRRRARARRRAARRTARGPVPRHRAPDFARTMKLHRDARHGVRHRLTNDSNGHAAGRANRPTAGPVPTSAGDRASVHRVRRRTTARDEHAPTRARGPRRSRVEAPGQTLPARLAEPRVDVVDRAARLARTDRWRLPRRADCRLTPDPCP